MANKHTTKKALLMSVISLLLCCSMLIGTTFAWFTDEVKSGVNQILAGNLDVEVYNSLTVGENKVGSSTMLFDEITYWEPGVVAYENLTVANLGTLALKYQLSVNFDKATTNANGDTLAKVLKVGFVEGGIQSTTREGALTEVNKWLPLESFVQSGKLDSVAQDLTAAKTSDSYGIVIWWEPSSIDNEFNMNNENKGKIMSIELGIKLVATQLNAEDDSFGPDYDEDAWHPEMKVYSAQDLQAAINNGETNIVLMDDIVLDGSIVIPAPVGRRSAPVEPTPITIDLNGKTITGNNTRADGALIVNNGFLVLNGNNQSAISNQATDGASVIQNNGTLVINGGRYVAAPWGGTNTAWPSYAINSYSDITINGGVIVGSHGAVAVNDGSTGVINGGDISITGCKLLSDHVLYAPGASKLTVNGGNFTMAYDSTVGGDTLFSGNCVVTGGTFNEDPSKYVAAGFKAVAVDGVYYVVADNVAGVVTKPETLKDALSAAGAAGAGNTTIAFFGNIDMSGTAWTPIKVDGYHGADIVTIEGNGATITGLTAPLFAGGFAGGSGIVIKDLTIADSNIVSNNTLGTGAFIESVDSMDTITLTNCHLVNSTVTGGDGSRTGGLIGWTAGYNNVNDGPVKTYVTITDCSVVDCTITSNGSVGGIYGHAGNNAWTYSTIENCTVKDCDLISTDDGGWRVGVVVGTANVGEVSISNITESGNTLSQTGKTAPAGQSNLYGRFVPGTTGKLVIDGKTVAADTAGVNNALNNGEDVVLMDDVKVLAAEVGSNGYGATGVKVSGSTLDGNGNSLGVDAWGTWDSAINISGGTIKNLKVNCGMRGIFMGSATADVYIDNVIIDGTIYTFNSDGGDKNYGVYISNSTLNGWTSHSDVHKEVVYTNCEFGEGQGYAFCRPYGPTKFIGCNFSEGFTVDPRAAVTFENCTINGVALTAENVADLVTNTANATVK